MSDRFFIADTHFGHAGVAHLFKGKNGAPLRPFSSAEEMDETLVKNWNEVVRPFDKIYLLGDAVINKKNLPILGRLNGKKRLIMGNHDIFPSEDYLAYFDEVWGVRVLVDEMIMSHVPLHPDSITRRFKVNVHGHLHDGDVRDGRYLCVSCEHTNYRPLHLDEVRERVAEKTRRFPFKYKQDHAEGPG